LKLYLKLFIWFGGGYALIKGISVGISEGLNRGIFEGLINGVFFGIFMSIVIGWWQKRKNRKISKKNVKTLNPNQLETFNVSGKFDDIFEKSLVGIKSFKGKLYVSDKKNSLIQATTSISWKSFGENIEILLNEKENNIIEITISSKPVNPIQIVDYGKGRQNVLSFIEYMNKS
tara:strand:- start:112 stop:633 length:522 start_codon:yes stop_codon:yes gene_type:complete